MMSTITVSKSKLKYMLLAGVISYVIGSSYVIVPPNTAGVQVWAGSVLENTLDNGLHLQLPFTRTFRINNALQTIQIHNAPSNTRDIQPVTAQFTITYSIKSENSRAYYLQNPNMTSVDDIVVPAANEITKSIISQYTVYQLNDKRREISKEILINLNERLRQFYVSIDSISLVNFTYSKEYLNAVGEKVIAMEKAKQAKYDAERIITVGKAEGEAIKSTGTEAYIRLRQNDKWDGKLPNTLVNGNATPIVGTK